MLAEAKIMVMGVRRTGQWREARVRLRRAPRDLPAAIRRSVRLEAKFMLGKVRAGVNRQNPGDRSLRPLASTTLATRRASGSSGRRALIATGEMIRSMRIIPRGRRLFAGVPSSARGGDGRRLVIAARSAEGGIARKTTRMTPAMRRFLHAVLGSDGGDGDATIRRGAPARPMFAPVFRKFTRPGAVRKRMERRLNRMLQGSLGTK